MDYLIPKGFKKCSTIQNRWVNKDGVVINSDAKVIITVVHKGTDKDSYTIPIVVNGKQTVISRDLLYKDAWYPDCEAILFKDDDRTNLSEDNIIPLYKSDKGITWGKSDYNKLLCLRDGRCYGRTRTRLNGSLETKRLRYMATRTKSYLHVELMLEAFGYLTSCNMFDIDLTKPLSLDEILDSHVGYPVWKSKNIVHPDEYVYDIVHEDDNPIYKPVKIVGRIAMYRGVTYSYTGYVVGEDGYSIEPKMVGDVPFYNNIPVKVGVFKAFSPNTKLKHNRVEVLDGNEENTNFRNLKG